MKTARFSIPEVCRKQKQPGDGWMEVFDAPALSMGLYHIPVGTNDCESYSPHDCGEVYIGVSGKGASQSMESCLTSGLTRLCTSKPAFNIISTM